MGSQNSYHLGKSYMRSSVKRETT